MDHNFPKTARTMDVCRLCLQKHEEMFNIFCNDSDYKLIEKIQLLASIQILPDDGMPRKICGKCRARIDDYVEFRQQIKNSYSYLLSVVNTNIEPLQEESFATDKEAKSDKNKLLSNNNSKFIDREVIKATTNVIDKRVSHATVSDSKMVDPYSDVINLDCQNYNKDIPLQHILSNKQIHCNRDIKTGAITVPENNESIGFKSISNNGYCVQNPINNSDKRDDTITNYILKPSEGFDEIGKYLKNIVDYEKLKCDMQNLKNEASVTKIKEEDSVKKLWERLAQKGVVVIGSKKLNNESEYAIKGVKREIVFAKDFASGGKETVELKNVDTEQTDGKCQSSENLLNLEQFVKQDVHMETAPRMSELHRSAVHKKSLTKTNDNLYVCHLCLRSFKTVDAVPANDHSYQHFESIDRKLLLFQNSPPFQCEICDETFHTRHSFVLHQRIHLGVNPFACKVCGASFPSDEQSKVHESGHVKSEQGRRMFKCNLCSKQFKRRNDFKCHESAHLPRQKIMCSTCKKIFSNSATLRAHQKRHIGGNYPTLCEKCPMTFYSKAEFLRHEQKHTGKQFLCGKCTKSFCTNYELSRHEKYHNKEKTHNCAICNKKFYEACHLKIHMRSHTKDYRHICDICAKAFCTLAKLNRHLKIHEVSNSHRARQKISQSKKVLVKNVDPKIYCKLNLNELGHNATDESYIIVTESDGESDNIFLKTESDNVQMFTDNTGTFYFVNDAIVRDNKNVIVTISDKFEELQ